MIDDLIDKIWLRKKFELNQSGIGRTENPITDIRMAVTGVLMCTQDVHQNSIKVFVQCRQFPKPFCQIFAILFLNLFTFVEVMYVGCDWNTKKKLKRQKRWVVFHIFYDLCRLSRPKILQIFLNHFFWAHPFHSCVAFIFVLPFLCSCVCRLALATVSWKIVSFRHFDFIPRRTRFGIKCTCFNFSSHTATVYGV